MLAIYCIGYLAALLALPVLNPAADYFLANRWLAWFSTQGLDIIPVHRDGRGDRCDPLADCRATLAAGDIVILFPEGSRGRPEAMQPLKKASFICSRRAPRYR